jgi:hypothetical protein
MRAKRRKAIRISVCVQRNVIEKVLTYAFCMPFPCRLEYAITIYIRFANSWQNYSQVLRVLNSASVVYPTHGWSVRTYFGMLTIFAGSDNDDDERMACVCGNDNYTVLAICV